MFKVEVRDEHRLYDLVKQGSLAWLNIGNLSLGTPSVNHISTSFESGVENYQVLTTLDT